jgi:plastocyanin
MHPTTRSLKRRIMAGAVLSLLIQAPAALADTIVAKLHFDSALPFTGILYVPDEKALPLRAVLDQKDKAFSLPLVTASPGAELEIRNSDDFEHNIYADDRQQTGIALDLGTIAAHDEMKLPVKWKGDSLLRLGCKIHPKMKTYVANIKSQHAATIPFVRGQQDYDVILVGVPAHLPEVRLLLPNLPMFSATLKVGESITLPIQMQTRAIGRIELTRRSGS